MEYIKLQNYRCFENTGNIPLKPLMLLVGANSSGKSSFLKQFPLLKQSIGKKRNGIFLWNLRFGVDLNNFSNSLRDGTDTMTIDYGIENLNLIKDRVNLHKEQIIQNVRISLDLKKINERFEYLNRLRISFYDQIFEIVGDKEGLITELKINGHTIGNEMEKMLFVPTTSLLPRIVFIENGQIEDEYSIECRKIIRNLDERGGKLYKDHFSLLSFNRFSKAPIASQKEVNSYLTKLFKNTLEEYSLNDIYIWLKLNQIIDSINYYFIDLAESITYIQPVRATAERYYRIDNIATDDINSDGTNLAMFLYNLSKEELKDFQKWTKRMFNFSVRLKASEGHVQIMIESTESHSIRNMTDVGFGYSQILPILAIMWKTLKDTEVAEINNQEHENDLPRRIIVMEQPELHLHPKFISMFAYMIARIISEMNKQKRKVSIMIETHSSALINGIGENIANMRSFNTDDVSVLIFNAYNEFIDSDKEINYIETSSFDPHGYLKNWPYGFFLS